MWKCDQAQLRELRKLERHTAWLQQHIRSKHIQQLRNRQVLELRTQLCTDLGCSGDEIEQALRRD